MYFCVQAPWIVNKLNKTSTGESWRDDDIIRKICWGAACHECTHPGIIAIIALKMTIIVIQELPEPIVMVVRCSSMSCSTSGGKVTIFMIKIKTYLCGCEDWSAAERRSSVNVLSRIFRWASRKRALAKYACDKNITSNQRHTVINADDPIVILILFP